MTRSSNSQGSDTATRSLSRFGLIALASIWCGLALLFGLHDLDISQTLVDVESRFGILTESYGEIPGLCAIVFSLFVVHTNRRRRRLALEIPVWIFTIGLSSIVGYYAMAILYSRLVGSFDWFSEYGQWFWLALASALLALHLATMNHRFSGAIDRYARITVGIAVVNILVFVQIIKPLWGRVRYRDLDPDFLNFSPWYLPQGVTDASSFPSGHAALGWMLLPLILLASSRSTFVKWLVTASIVIWGVGVSLGRVVAGAHYASDVLFSTGVAFASYMFWYTKYALNQGTKESDPTSERSFEAKFGNTP